MIRPALRPPRAAHRSTPKLRLRLAKGGGGSALQRKVRGALRRALEQLRAQRNPEGVFEGNMDGGVVFTAANVVLERFIYSTSSQEADARELELLRHLLAGQHPSGLFAAYPDGPLSCWVTRVALLAARRVRASNAVLRAATASATRAALDEAIHAGERALRETRPSHREPPYLLALWLLLKGFDRESEPVPRWLPRLPLPPVSPLLAGPLVRSRLWRRFDGRVFPFLTVAFPLLCLCADSAFRRSLSGRAWHRGLRAVPLLSYGRRHREALQGLARWVLDHQDSTGGFYYSSLYTQVFIAGMKGVLAEEEEGALREQARGAVERAQRYVVETEVHGERGVASRFLGSDVWDTAAVVTAALSGGAPAFDAASLAHLAKFLLEHQHPSGGWSFGRGSRFPDSDSTALVTGALAELVKRRLVPQAAPAVGPALVRALDFLVANAGTSGGYGAWHRAALSKPPGAVGELTSIFLDVPTADLTARVAYGLAKVRELRAVDPRFCRQLGKARLSRLDEVRRGALDFLLAERDPQTGLWSARWTLGYLSGTSFVLEGLSTYALPELPQLAAHAARTVLRAQNWDGGFGESPRSDREGRFTPCEPSAVLPTASALNILRFAGQSRADRGYRAALEYLLSEQQPDGAFPEKSLYTQFTGLYASYSLMTLVAATALLLREEAHGD